MRFRFTLSSETLGAVILERNPKGWDDMELVVSRGKETHGFFYEQIANLQFYCGAGKEYIDEVRSIEGIDANIGINISVACGCTPGEDLPDYSIDYSDDYGSMSEGDCEWETLYDGILDMKSWESEKNFTNVNIIESSFFRDVRNRMNTVVDLLATETIDGTALSQFTFGPYDLNLHSKVIRQIGDFNYADLSTEYPGYTLQGETVNSYEIEFDVSDREEDDSYSQTIIPEVEVTNEIPVYIGDVNTLAPGPFPADNTQYQSGTFIEVVSTAPNTFDVSGKIKWAFDSYALVTSFNDVFADRNISTTITSISLYLQAGSNIYLLTSVDDIISSVDINIGPPITQELVPLTVRNFEFSETGIPVENGDEIKIYIKFDLQRDIQRPPLPLQEYNIDLTNRCFTSQVFDEDENSFIHIVTDSVAEDSVGKAFARFEAGAKISQIITNRTDAFRSNYFGRKNSEPYAYDLNGCGSFASILSGFWVRGFPITGDKARTTKMSLMDYYESNSGIDNLGLGVEIIDGLGYVVIEPVEYFYDSSTVLLTLNNVPDIIVNEAVEYYYNAVNIGYNKWKTEFVNGLDEPNSKRFLSTGIKAVDTPKTIISNFVAGGYPLEDIRRMNYSNSVTTDTDYDEDNFIVCLNRSVDGSGIPTMLDVAEKDENFSQVNNLISPETSYNLRITPYHNYLRHNNIINPDLLKYAGREVKFMGGEGNYKMESQFDSDDCPGNWNNALLNEGQNIQWDDANNTDNNPLWIPEIAKFKFPISYTDFKVLKNNPKGVILVSDTSENHIPYFILEVKYIPANGGLADFKLLRAYQ